MIKFQILTTCDQCKGQAYIPIGEYIDHLDRKILRHVSCPRCEGSGQQLVWVSLAEFAVLLQQAVCLHEQSTMQGGMHFTAGTVWDDITEVCSDCGAKVG